MTTKAKLIEMLSSYPDDAIIRIFDAESGQMEPVTGCETQAEWKRQPGVFTIDLCSDLMGG